MLRLVLPNGLVLLQVWPAGCKQDQVLQARQERGGGKCLRRRVRPRGKARLKWSKSAPAQDSANMPAPACTEQPGLKPCVALHHHA